MIVRCIPLLLLAVAGPALAALAGPYGEPALVCRFQGPEVVESSGLASSSRSNEYFFTHNDSGDGPRFYAVNRRGEILATLAVPGATHLDWEDMARGPDDRGRPALFLGDIGDNERKRPYVTVYRVPEPEIDPGRTGVARDTERAVRFDLTYPDGPRDAETLMVHPATGRIFIVSKSLAGSSVYAAPETLRADAPNGMTKVGAINFAPLPSSAKSLEDQVRRMLATGGDIASDGSALAIRTYMDAYEWKLSGDVGAALQRRPVHVPVPPTQQAEALAYGHGSRSLLTSSEGRNAPVHELPRRE